MSEKIQSFGLEIFLLEKLNIFHPKTRLKTAKNNKIMSNESGVFQIK